MNTDATGMLIQAYDVGYGWVKFTSGARNNGDRLQCDCFESISIPSRKGNIAAGVMERHDVFDVEVGGKRYTVGKDVRLAASANDAVLVATLL